MSQTESMLSVDLCISPSQPESLDLKPRITTNDGTMFLCMVFFCFVSLEKLLDIHKQLTRVYYCKAVANNDFRMSSSRHKSEADVLRMYVQCH